ncbi:MAG: hypothetical protein ACI9N9_001976 [Enterobacterales bacterium]|jgi:hypothetical protein
MTITRSYGLLIGDTDVPKLYLTKRLLSDVSRPRELFPDDCFVRSTVSQLQYMIDSR